MENINYFFSPKSVAVIGASREKGKVGYAIFSDLLDKYAGEVIPVNPNATEILGRPCYPDITKVPKDVDLAVISVPAKFVPQVIRGCRKKKVRAVIIISAGFGEIGNKNLEHKILKEKGNMRIVGPNCLGIFDSTSGVDTLFLPEDKLKRPKPGNIAFITQSGAVGSVVLDMLSSEGYGMSKFISYGNGIDLNEIDFLEYLGNDDKTGVICLYIEGTKDGRSLMKTAKKVVKKKPILVLKAGRTHEGTAAVSSHTGSLAGQDEVYDAAFRQAGMIRVDDVRDMFDYAEALSSQPPAKGHNILIVTNGGGFGVVATDEAIHEGLKLPQLADETVKELQKCLPPYVKVHNPLDLGGDADSKRYAAALEIAGSDKNIDAVLCIVLFQTVSLNPEVVDVVAEFAKKSGKPIVTCSAGGEYVQKLMHKLEERGVPVFNSPYMAVKALWCLAKYGEILKKAQ